MDCILINGSDVFAPSPIGKKDILVLENRIARVDDHINATSLEAAGFSVNRINGGNRIAVPGFIDQHVHFNGAGGEGGPVYRTPPLQLSSLLEAGITTAVGLLGTDGSARSLRELLMKARALEQEGITTAIYTGSYQIPGPVITSDVMSDLIIVDKVIGIKIAYSDHRSSHVSIQKLQEIVSQARVGGILSGKAGIAMVHIGEGPSRLVPLLEVVENTDIPIEQFAPTHLNRSNQVLEESVEFGRRGGYVDISAGVSKRYGFSDAVDPAEAVSWLLDEGIPVEHITMSSDGNGVMTVQDPVTGGKNPLLAPVGAMLEEFGAMIKRGIAIEKAVRVVSTNVADHLLFTNKGRIAEGKDADLLLLDESLSIDTLIARGRICIEKGQLKKKGMFE